MKALVKIAALVAFLGLIVVGTGNLSAGEGYGWHGHHHGHDGWKEGHYYNWRTSKFEPIMEFPMGAEMVFAGEFGEKPGMVRLYMAGIYFDLKVVKWTPKAITVIMPVTELTEPTYGRLVAYGADSYYHRPHDSMPIKLIAAPAKPVAPAGEPVPVEVVPTEAAPAVPAPAPADAAPANAG